MEIACIILITISLLFLVKFLFKKDLSVENNAINFVDWVKVNYRPFGTKWNNKILNDDKYYSTEEIYDQFIVMKGENFKKRDFKGIMVLDA